MDTGVRSARNELFQNLKPTCVELTQLALRDDGSPSNTKALIQCTSKLLSILETQCKGNDGAFDEKLADYVFFPLSQMLKKKKKYTDRLSELIVKCLRILLEYGWSRTVPLDLAKQLLILLAFVAEGPPDQQQTVPEEISVEAYGALAALFRGMGVTPGGVNALVETATVPALGHCVSVILEGVAAGGSVEVQLQALKALQAVWRTIKDLQALATFLPGTISALVKSLMPGTANRRSRKTLIAALAALEQVLLSLLSDVQTRNIRNADKLSTIAPASTAEHKYFTKSWLKATTGQIKLALSNVIRLRKNDASDVRKALNRFCLIILDECHDTLSESASLLVETCMILDGVDKEDDFLVRRTTLTDLATIHPDIGELVKSTAYNWVTSLPRVMQANDESAKYNALDQLQKASSLLKNLNSESSILEDALGNALRDSITVTLEFSQLTTGVEETGFDLNSQAAMTLATQNSESAQFAPFIMGEESQRTTRESLTNLVTNLGTREAQIKMAGEMLEYVRAASGPSLLSAYWLSFQILKAAASENEDIDEFFDSAFTLSDDQESMNEELMSYSQTVLTSNNDGQYDWRIQATALEVVADRARRLKSEFRPELIDTLYPIAQLLGSPIDKLRQHAITCINIVSKECGYSSASDLIVDNVDYMVNAISLRLNTFDISPQAPQVLVMMLRLAGPSLLLYLDDVVGSIFAALDNFHGYQTLVEVLFSVLDEIVKVGSTSDQLEVKNESTASDKRRNEPPIPTMLEIITLLNQKSDTDPDPLTRLSAPQKPWKSAATLLDEIDARTESSSTNSKDEEGPPPPQDLAPIPLTRPYTLLQKITSLSQHYLTSPSSRLRIKLLALITTAAPSLSHNQDAFLPLVNDIWPVLPPLIHDSSPYVSISAINTIAVLCEHTGGFLKSRISNIWPTILSLTRQLSSQVYLEKGTGTSSNSLTRTNIYTTTNKKWEAMIHLLSMIVEFVAVDEEVIDEVVEILGSLIWERDSVRQALERGGWGDVVWLVIVKNSRSREKYKTPAMEGYKFVAVS